VENRKEIAQKEQDTKSTLPQFYKEFERGRKFGLTGIETVAHNFFWGALQQLLQQFTCAVTLGSLAMGKRL